MVTLNLRDYTTLRTPSQPADWFTLDTPEYSRTLEKLVRKNEQRYILAGGSNSLFVGDFPGLIIHVTLRGLELLDETETEVFVRVAAGEVWDDFVAHSLRRGWYGLENLSLIPGSVGAAPVQNIGAYGVEVKSLIERVDGFDLETGVRKRFSRGECDFGYRSSRFKTRLRNQFVITHVVFRLSKQPTPTTAYATLAKELERRGISDPTPTEVRDAVIVVRSARLPDWRTVPNAGSFFTNPIVSQDLAESLQKKHPEIPVYSIDDENSVKLSAAWLIDQAGLKSHWQGNVGTHTHQPLVIVTNGNATGLEIMTFAHDIIKRVYDIFGVTLVPEVTHVGHE